MSKAPKKGPDVSAGVPLDIHAAAKLVANQDFSLEVGSIELDQDGRLHTRDRNLPLNFEFTYREITFRAQVVTGAAPRVKLIADLGKLPFTVQLPQGRRWILQMLKSAGSLPRGRLWLSRAHDIFLEAEMEPPAPHTPVHVVAALTALLIDAKPHLELLTDILAGSGPAEPAPEQPAPG